jgi:hypothetical protein
MLNSKRRVPRGSIPTGVGTTASVRRAGRTPEKISWKDLSEIAKNLAQIIAFAVAGLWTYRVFIHKDAPSLQRHAMSGGSFEWTPAGSDICEGSFYVSLKNDGISDFAVARVRVRLWEFNDPSVEHSVAFVDRDSIESQRPSFQREYTDGVFIRRFPPGYQRVERYSCMFEKQPTRNVLVIVDFFPDFDPGAPEWSQFYSWRVCDYPKK